MADAIARWHQPGRTGFPVPAGGGAIQGDTGSFTHCAGRLICVLHGDFIPLQVILAAWTPGITPREAVLPAVRAVIIPHGEPDGILLRSIVFASIGVARIGVVNTGRARIVVVTGH